MSRYSDFEKEYEMKFTVGQSSIGFPPPAKKTREQELQEALKQTKGQLDQLVAFVDKLKEEPLSIGTVVRVTQRNDVNGSPKRGIVASPHGTLECNLLPACVVGSQVKILLTTKQITEVLDDPILFGPVAVVESYEEDELLVFFSSFANGMKASAIVPEWMDELKIGDRIRLDPTGQVVLENLGRDTERFQVEPELVTWDDIGGLEEAKEALREAIEYPIEFAELYERYGQKPARGVLLYGPPGCGKTLLARAVAGAVSEPEGYIYVKGAELLSKWVGEGESNVREIFARARAYKEETGNAAVIFIDEADAVLGIRGAHHHGVGTNQMLVPSFLAEMDGLDESGAFVILGTNRPEAIDPAILRDGRIDRRVRVGRPGRAAVSDILKINMRGRPCSDLDAFVAHGVEVLFSDDLALHELKFEDGHTERLRMRDVLSGAVVVGVVRRAVEFAIKRERQGGEACGVTLDDFSEACRASFREMTAVNHRDSIADMVEMLGRALVAVVKVEYDAGPRKEGEDPNTGLGDGRAGVQTPGGRTSN